VERKANVEWASNHLSSGEVDIGMRAPNQQARSCHESTRIAASRRRA
jgi:hypothetical protein